MSDDRLGWEPDDIRPEDIWDDDLPDHLVDARLGEMLNTPEDNARAEMRKLGLPSTDFDAIAKVAASSGCSMQDAANALRRVREASMSGTHVTHGGQPYVSLGEHGTRTCEFYKKPRRPNRFQTVVVWIIARILNWCGWRSSRVANGPIHKADLKGEKD